jgi:hypothetical protein
VSVANQKSVRGYYHLIIGGAILPSKYYVDYLKDEEGYVRHLSFSLASILTHTISRTLRRAREGKLKDKGDDACSFFYAYGADNKTYDINTGQPLLGLFRGNAIYRVSLLIHLRVSHSPVPSKALKCILLGPTCAVDPNKFSSGSRPNNAKLHDITSITPELCAYVCVQVRCTCTNLIIKLILILVPHAAFNARKMGP